MTINVKRHTDKAHLPKYMTRSSRFAEVVATRIIKNGLFRVFYDCQISLEIPDDHVMIINESSNISSVGLKMLKNDLLHVGHHRITVRFRRTFWGMFHRKQYKIGDRIAQIQVAKLTKVSYRDVKTLGENEQRKSG